MPHSQISTSRHFCPDVIAAECGQFYKSVNLRDGTSADALVFIAPMACRSAFYFAAEFPAAQQMQA